MKCKEYYIKKMKEASKRINKLDKVISSVSRVVRWRSDVNRLKAERDALADDVKGYRCIIAHIESGIDIGRYHNKDHARRILNAEKAAERRVNDDIRKT